MTETDTGIKKPPGIQKKTKRLKQNAESGFPLCAFYSEKSLLFLSCLFNFKLLMIQVLANSLHFRTVGSHQVAALLPLLLLLLCAFRSVKRKKKKKSLPDESGQFVTVERSELAAALPDFFSATPRREAAERPQPCG